MCADKSRSVESVAQQLRGALESAQISQFEDLLDPHVRWGAPDDDSPSCTNRTQVLAWYQRGREAGVRARATEVVVRGDKILVGLQITGGQATDENDGSVERWQVIEVRNGRIVDIRGFEERVEAAARAGVI